MPMVRRFVTETFGREPLATLDPDHVVALGAAVQTALMTDDRSVEDMVMTDVCPFTLGVEVVKEFGSTVREGYFLPVIHRNTTIPVSREEVVATVQNRQREMRVRVYQGESRRVEDNLLLGELSVTGLPVAPAGLPVHLRFTYDLNGILEVEAYVPKTGRKHRAVLHQHVKGLSPAEIEKAVANLRKLKFYPRDEARNQYLVRFGRAGGGGSEPLPPRGTGGLGRPVRGGHGLGRPGIFFAAARQHLLILLNELGFPASEEARDRDDETA